MSWKNIDLFQFEATMFGEYLQHLVIAIYEFALQELDRVYKNDFKEVDNEITSAAAARDESRQEELMQYEDYLESQREEQIRALATMALAMAGALTESFLNEARTRLNKTHPRTKEKYHGDGWLGRRVTEYAERFNVDLTKITGFPTIREVILGRNSCLHDEGGRPSEDYTTQTAQRFVDKDGYINLNLDLLKQVAKEMSAFAEELYNRLAAARKQQKAVQI
jgi:hypothetical protein